MPSQALTILVPTLSLAPQHTTNVEPRSQITILIGIALVFRTALPSWLSENKKYLADMEFAAAFEKKYSEKAGLSREYLKDLLLEFSRTKGSYVMLSSSSNLVSVT